MSAEPKLRPPAWRRYLRFWRSDADADVDDELRFHLDTRTEDLVSQGSSRERAAAQALTEFGDLATVRDTLRAIDRRVIRGRSRREQWSGLGYDVWYAVRRLWGSPMFTIAATLTLAIAIGATASVFGVVDGVLLKAFPYRDPAHVLTVWESNPSMQMLQAGVAAADYHDFRAQTRAFGTLAAASYQQFTVTGKQDPERVVGAAVTASYFQALGLTPVLGRPLAPDSVGSSEVVIGYGLWQRRFGGAPSVLGQTLTVDNRPYTIVGVTPRGLPGPEELLTRLNLTPAGMDDRGDKDLFVLGRLASGVTREQAERDLEMIARRLSQAYPQTNAGWSARIIPLVDFVVGDVRPALTMLLAAALCVQLIGAANLANLFLVRCLGREREMAVRTALGATRPQLVREVLLEAGLLGLTAGALGVALAVSGVRALRALAPVSVPRLAEIGVDGRVVAFGALISIGTVLVVGVAPAWQASRSKPVEMLKQGGRGTGSAQHRRAQDVLVVLQVAVALILLTGAGLLLESFDHFRRMDLGFEPGGVLTSQILLPTDQYPTPERQTAFVARLVQQLAAQPGVEAASASSTVPAELNQNVLGYAVVGDPPPDAANVPLGTAVAASPSYFHTMSIRVRRGRGLLSTDDRRAVRVAVVDERLVRQTFGDRDPIGRRITFVGTPDTMEIIGVAGSVKEGGLAEPDRPEIYVSFAQSPSNVVTIAERVSGDPAARATAFRRMIASLDPTVPVFDVATMSDRMAQSIGTTRFSSFLASLFALVALILGALGIYSVLAYTVAQRKRETAVRIALGASRADVMGDVLRRAVTLAGGGIVLGSVAAWMLTRALASLFVGVSPHNPGIFAAAAGLFALVALVAASVPAFRTTRVDPVVALATL
jgi:putative ABC transport system permease protein